MSGEKSDKPKKSEPLDSDHLLMTTLAALVECENATRHDPQGFIKYKVKVKETLEILLSKLERNQYEQYLETEIEEFEDRLMMSSYNPANEDSRLDVIRDEDFPTLPTDERIDTGDSVEIIHVSQASFYHSLPYSAIRGTLFHNFKTLFTSFD